MHLVREVLDAELAVLERLLVLEEPLQHLELTHAQTVQLTELTVHGARGGRVTGQQLPPACDQGRLVGGDIEF
ncbi:hypothetical protein KCMC57_up54180 [Kitasatospora sp. CMC57]|uniref:Uncharacterized protein n=1 Tax=Kitasatospora sp. CMC57 TaxID=3231513 RepID=A0AB33K2M8_9ACTN